MTDVQFKLAFNSASFYISRQSGIHLINYLSTMIYKQKTFSGDYRILISNFTVKNRRTGPRTNLSDDTYHDQNWQHWQEL